MRYESFCLGNGAYYRWLERWDGVFRLAGVFIAYPRSNKSLTINLFLYSNPSLRSSYSCFFSESDTFFRRVGAR
jgi:hypothetical protein